MDTGSLNQLITIQTLVITQTNGHDTESWSEAEVVRANIVQIDGSRYLKEDELTDRQVYRIKVWDNNYSDNLRIGYGTLNLIPIQPIIKNPGKSFLNEVIIVAATKASSVLTA